MTERLGVADIIHPTKEELELIPHCYVHNNYLRAFRSNGWTEHPEFKHVGGEVPGYYVLIYMERE